MPIATRSRSAEPDQATDPEQNTPESSRIRVWRLFAITLGLLSAACALAVPFMPVVQDTARIAWPANGDTSQVNAPLTAYWAEDLSANFPCATVRSLDQRTDGPAMLFSTVPEARVPEGTGMQLQVDNGLLIVSNRAQQLARQPLPPENCDIVISSTVHATTITVAGQVLYGDSNDVRPRIVGIYTDITAEQDPITGLDVSVTPDTRYQSSPTGWKTAVSALCVLSLIGCLIAVNRLDSRVARRAPKWAPVGWWRLTGRDTTVFVALGVWVFIGPVTSDDGYILTMSRVTEDAGFLTNYHRWFGVAEAPFGWFYHVYELMSHVSVVPPWIRLPSFLLGVISWLLISREVMPRLGTQVRTSRAAGWAAAAVFLVWWMPFNNGVRPEPVAAVGSLLAICAVERALVTRRLLPLCLGLLAAALALAATPTGLIAVAPFLVAGRPLVHLLKQRARGSWSAVLAPIFAAGLMVLVVVFADQTFATVQEATRIRSKVGPSLSWFEELSRYELLFSPTADGSATRRFPVLLLLLCTGACLVVLLRRGRIPGAALGPSRRLIGTVALFFLLLALTPTKWTHHFGAFAAVGAAMAALTALASSSTVLRSKRNRAGFLAGLLVVAALAMTGPNAYWFVSNMGVPWAAQAPTIQGVNLSTILLVAAAISAVVAFIENVRAQRPDRMFGIHQEKERGRALKLGSLSLVVVCGLMATAEFASMAWAIQTQRSSYSLGAANFGHLFGRSCNLSDHVMVEREPVSSVLSALPPEKQATAPIEQPEQTDENALPLPDLENGPVQSGFHREPIDTNDPLDEPPHGFKTDTVPMWSSYRTKESPTGRLRSDWYDLSERPAGGQIVIATMSPPTKATTVDLEFGAETDEGMKTVRSLPVLVPGGGNFRWNDVRIGLDFLPPEVSSVRVVAADNDLTEDGWVAATAPRVPTFTTLTERVGDAPVYLDWPASFVYPCMNPMKVRDGIAELPSYRVTAGDLAFEADWAGSKTGGPNGFLEEVADQPEVPSFLMGQPGAPWGVLKQLEPYTDGAPPMVIRGQEVHSGWWSPGPGPAQPDGTQPTR
ncbi:arabinosyltransferase domain-containing protein [Amycolatopsis lurida]